MSVKVWEGKSRGIPRKPVLSDLPDLLNWLYSLEVAFWEEFFLPFYVLLCFLFILLEVRNKLCTYRRYFQNVIVGDE